jgi:hypothetical protein
MGMGVSHTLEIAIYVLKSANGALFYTTLHRGAFKQFSFRWIYYCNSSKSTGKETGKTHLCAL